MLISPSIHEKTISRHLLPDETDETTLHELTDAIKRLRETCNKASDLTATVLKNEMVTPAQRHAKARAAGFKLFTSVSGDVDAAIAKAREEITALTATLAGPKPPKDLIAEARQREIRERLATFPPDRRKQIIDSAIEADDDNLVGAVLGVPGWMVAMQPSEQDVVRHRWGARRHPGAFDRRQRLGAALDDARRAGEAASSFIDGLTDASLVKKAEGLERAAADALKAAQSVG